MLRISTRRLLVLLPLLAVAFSWGCSRPSHHIAPFAEPKIPPCPNFAVRETTIHVTSAGGQFDLGDDNKLTFPANAIASGDSAVYHVTAAPKHDNQNVAGIQVDSVSGPMRFHKAVTLRLSYNKCPQLGDSAIVIMEKHKGKPGKSIGGAKLPDEKAIEALIGSFTEYAIAM